MFLNTELFGHQRGASNKGYKKIKYNTMILSTQNLHLGNANVNQRFEHGMVSPAYKTYEIIGCSADLVAQWIKSEAAKKFFYDATTVGASVCRRNVEWETLYEQRLHIPCPDEQKKIAAFLALVSKRIDLQQQMVAALKKYKRGAISHILSSRDNVLAISSWTEKSLADLCCEFKSGRNISATNIHETGQYPVYGGNGIRGYCDQYSHDGKYVVVGRQGALCGNVRLIRGQNYLSEHAIAVRANSENVTEFLLYLLDFMKLGQYSDQGAQPGLAVNKLLRLKCTVPDKETQTRIAHFLLCVDKEIAVQERLASSLTNQRRAFMQQLFI